MDDDGLRNTVIVCTIAALLIVIIGMAFAISQFDKYIENGDHRDDALYDIRARWIVCWLGFALLFVWIALIISLFLNGLPDLIVWELGQVEQIEMYTSQTTNYTQAVLLLVFFKMPIYQPMVNIKKMLECCSNVSALDCGRELKQQWPSGMYWMALETSTLVRTGSLTTQDVCVIVFGMLMIAGICLQAIYFCVWMKQRATVLEQR